MKKASYGWLLKFILAAILITVGATMFFRQELVYLITGLGIVIFSLFRIVPLMKSLNKEVLRTINLIEVLIDTILGAIMIYAGIQALNNELALNDGWGLVYRYTLVTVFVIRAIVFLYSVTFLGEKTEQVKFWSHIIVFAIGVAMAAYQDFNAEWVAWLILFISVLGGGYLIYDGTRGYGKYREFSKELNEGKVKEKEVKKDKRIEKELPKESEVIIEKDDDRPYVS
ncbi:hypothetical protein [Acholeplasma hippikon]|uniref:Uncharacterized protein n=1 Tax=Acholeplasma hippikon TaxID=264636 RepID=A0A449BI72_9MOLU|nr:hypothetical protein [Acholeplasma hippikon]VEU82154.1 Uncharacterised protein [Acholeplasma hippikon]